MKRVLFVDHGSRVLSGAEINLIELLSELRHSENLQVACACPEGSPLFESLRPLGVRLYDFRLEESFEQLRFSRRAFPWARILSAFSGMKVAAEHLRRIIREARTDVVVSCRNKDHFAAVKACAGTQARATWWVNDLITKDFFSWPARVAFRKYAAGADRVVAVSDCVGKALLSLSIPTGKTLTIHNGIPLEKYQSGEQGVFRHHHNLPQNEPLFGLIGRFCDWKGHDFFLQVAMRWAHARRPGHFVLVGPTLDEDQAYVGRLQNYVRKNSLQDRVHFVPFQQKVADVLTDLDVLVHAAKRPEPFGRIIVEAMAVGTPVIAANAGGPREIIAHGENGLLARAGDPEDYVTKLREAWPITAGTQKWIANARKTVEDRFNLKRVKNEFEELLQKIH